MSQTVDFYLSKGFEPKMAKYFASGRKKIISVVANNDFTLLLTFDNSEKRIFDMKKKKKKDFKRVYIDDSNCVCWDRNPNVDSEVDWNNKVDLSSDVCYVDSKPIS